MSKTLILNIDMKKNIKVIQKIKKKYSNPEILLIIDPNIVYIVADFLIENGWLGEETTKQLQNVMLSNLKILREKWIEFAKENMKNIKIIKANGNFKEILEEKIKSENITELIVTFKKGFNPYWNVLKHVIENICKKYNIKLKILN